MRRDVDRWLDGDLPAGRRDRVAAHVEKCQVCRALVASAAVARNGLLALPRLQPTDDLRARISKAVAASAGPRGLEVLGHLPRLTPSPESRARIASAVAPLVAARQERLCRRFGREVDALLDGELPEWLALAFEGHVRRCERCAEVHRAAEIARARLAGLDRAPVRAPLRRALREAARARRRPAHAPWLPAAAAAALLVLVVGMGVVQRQGRMRVTATPRDVAVDLGDHGAIGNAPTGPPRPEPPPRVVAEQPSEPGGSRETTTQYVSRPARSRPTAGTPRAPQNGRRPETTPGPPDTYSPDRTSEPVVVIAGAAPVSVSAPVASSESRRNATTVGRVGDGPLSL